MRIETVIILSILLVVLLISFIILILFYHLRRKRLMDLQLQRIIHAFNMELLKCKLETADETMREISMELHDNIGQMISVARLNLVLIESKITVDLQHDFFHLKRLIENIGSEIRNLTRNLHSNLNGETLITDILEEELSRIKMVAEIKTSLQIQGENRMLEKYMHTIIYRMIQEILNNILKHSKASEISVLFRFEKEKLFIAFKDNGIGFDLKSNMASNKGQGLKNVTNRAKMINADFSIVSSSSGTNIEILVPINQ